MSTSILARCAFMVLWTLAVSALHAAPPQVFAPKPLSEEELVYNWDPQSNLGPATWGSRYPACQTGPARVQSPIALTGQGSLEGTLTYAYKSYSDTVRNTGHGILLPVGSPRAAGSIRLDNGPLYYFVEFHVHTRSEHTIDGVMQDLEVHMVHSDDGTMTGHLAVIAVLFRKVNQGGNQAVSQLINHAPSSPGQGGRITVDPSHLLSQNGNSVYYEYGNGSLTTPECGPVAVWLVGRTLGTVDTAAVDHLEALVRRFKDNPGSYNLNNRPIDAGATTSIRFVQGTSKHHISTKEPKKLAHK